MTRDSDVKTLLSGALSTTDVHCMELERHLLSGTPLGDQKGSMHASVVKSQHIFFKLSQGKNCQPKVYADEKGYGNIKTRQRSEQRPRIRDKMLKVG